MRYYLTPVRIATVKKSKNNKCWQGCGGKGPCYPVYWCIPYGKQYGVFSKKKKIEQPCDSEIPLMGIYLKKVKALI